VLFDVKTMQKSDLGTYSTAVWTKMAQIGREKSKLRSKNLQAESQIRTKAVVKDHVMIQLFRTKCIFVMSGEEIGVNGILRVFVD